MRRAGRASRWIAAALTIGIGGAGCGAGEDEPAPANALPAATCPPLETLAPRTMGHLRAGRLEGLRHVLSREVAPDELAVMLDGLLRMVRGLTPDQLRALLRLARDERLAALLPLMAELLRHVAGDPAVPGSFRGDVLSESSRLLATCEGATLFRALDGLLASPELPALLSSLAASLRLEVVRRVLGGDVRAALDRDGFTELVCGILDRIAGQDFDFHRDVTEPLSRIDLLPLDEPPLSDLLAALDATLDPERPLMPALTDLLCCDLYGVPECPDPGVPAPRLDRDPVFTWLLYDFFVTSAVRFDALLDTLGELAADPAIAATLEPLRAVLGRLSDDADLRAATVRLLRRLLVEENARRVLPELALLLEDGAVPELLGVASAVLDGCDPGDLGASR